MSINNDDDDIKTIECFEDLDFLAETTEDFKIGDTLSIHKLFPPHFMYKYTSCNSFNNFIEIGNFSYNNQEEFDALVCTPEFEEHVIKYTSFKTWKSMVGRAVNFFAADKLGVEL